MALTAVWKEDRIEGLRERLERLRDQAMLHLVSDLRLDFLIGFKATEGFLHLTDYLSARQVILSEALETQCKESSERDSGIKIQLAKLAEQMTSIEEVIPVVVDNAPLDDLRTRFANLSSLVQKVTIEVKKSHAILKSLR